MGGGVGGGGGGGGGREAAGGIPGQMTVHREASDKPSDDQPKAPAAKLVRRLPLPRGGQRESRREGRSNRGWLVSGRGRAREEEASIGSG